MFTAMLYLDTRHEHADVGMQLNKALTVSLVTCNRLQMENLQINSMLVF
jgi:hypothetical protein